MEKRCHSVQEVGLLPVGPRKEPLIPKNPPKNTYFVLELLQPCSKKEDPVTLKQKGLETIAILSQDNFAIAYTDGSSDRSLSNGGAGILLLLPDGNNYKHKINTGIIASNFTSELMAIRESLILYQQDPHVIDSTEGLVIFSDSKSAIEAIRNEETNISCDIITLLEHLHSKRKSCILQWIPAHVDIEDGDRFNSCQVIYSQFGLVIHQNDHQARRRFVEWAQNEIAVVPDFHKRILFSDEAHFWLNGYVNKQNYRIWSEANPQVYVETPLHPEKLTVWCALWAGGILLQKR
ncbi:RNase H domain-containing protein [Trichonephila clavipes]|nr:RNase H domain-containing protein [Trichonephila clavipes]